MVELAEAAKRILLDNMKLSSDENVLILYDENKQAIAEVLLAEAKKITSDVDWWQVKVAAVNGEEPKSDIADMMRNYDVIVIATTKSMSWTNARAEASKSGARIASMPDITEDILERTMEADYSKVKERCLSLIRFLKEKREMRITSHLGTDLVVVINPDLHGANGGIYDDDSKWGNLPAGEVFFAPLDSNGVVVVDASFAGIGKLEEPIKLAIENNKVILIEGGEQAKDLRAMLNSHGPKAFVVAEVGIGANDKAQVIGKILEDEKVLGTVHVALGRNDLFGGSNNVNIHVDGVFTKASIEVDGEDLMKDGELKI